jgi:GTP-binding protein HflX
LNALIGSDDAKVEDKLFATLEPITRRIKLHSGRIVLFSDTVGFIRKLPHTIIAAFRATLEEIKESDLLVHVVDISDPYYKTKIRESLRVLEDIGAVDIPRLLVFNKIDLVPDIRIEAVMEEFPDALFMSVKKGVGIEELLERVDHELSKTEEIYRIKIPTEMMGKIYSSLDRLVIEEQRFQDGFVEIKIRGRREVIEEIVGKFGGEVTE